MEAWALDAIGARDAIARGELSAEELTRACLDRAEALDGEVAAWAAIDPELALGAARAAEPGPLHGVPFGVKDVFNTREHPTAMGSAHWAGHAAGNDARVVFNAKRAGSVVLGKTVTAELGVHDPGPTRNPHDAARSAGTSSTGSAAAVACAMVPWALGTQSAGSIVRPASYCGVYGFKPSYGSIPRTGALKTTDTLDSIGMLCRSPRDLRPLFEALRLHGGDHPYIHSSLDPAAAGARRTSRAPRIALLTDGLGPLWEAAAPDAREALERFAGRLVAAGAEVIPAAVPAELHDAHAVHAMIYDRCLAYYFRAEAEGPAGVGPLLAPLVAHGRTVSLAQYTRALERQEAIRRAHDTWLAGFDAALTLSTAGTAPERGGEDVVDSALVWTLTGAPALSAPALAGADGMPLGAQLVGRRWHDHALLDVADWLTGRGLLGPAPIAHVPVAAAA